MSKKIIFLLIILVLIGVVGAYAIYKYQQPASTNIMKGDHNILLLLADTDEKRPGIGAVDMAYSVQVVNGSIENLTPIYPGGMTSSTLMEPAGAGTGKLKLNDVLWNNDTTQDAADAQSIVQENTGIKTDGVVIVTPQAVDAMISSVGSIDVPGYGVVTNNSIDVIRKMTEEKNSTLSRGNATDLLMKPVLSAANDPTKAPALFQAIAQQYLQGNIIVVPQDLMTQFAVSKGLDSI